MNEIVTMNLLPYTSYELMIDTTIPRNLISKVDVETVTLMITEFWNEVQKYHENQMCRHATEPFFAHWLVSDSNKFSH